MIRSGDGPRHAAPDDSVAEARPPASRRASALTGGSRRAAPRHAGGARRQTAARVRGRWPAVALLVALAAVAAVLVVLLVRRDAAPGADGTDAAPGADGTTDVEVGVPDALVAWLDADLPEGASVAVAPGLRDDLLGAGADPALLRDPAPEAAGDAATPALALAETAPEGSRLLARFEREGDAPLLLVDPEPVEPTPDERRQRETLAAAVLANPDTRTGGNAREVLTAADVDARLLALIGAATAQQGLGLGAFPRLPGEEPGTAPARRVLVDAYGGRPVPADDAATQRLVTWLDAQLPPFAPADVQVTGEGVLIAFDYAPGPDAVVGEATR